MPVSTTVAASGVTFTVLTVSSLVTVTLLAVGAVAVSLLLVDWGARVGFYNSDLTRVMALGRIPTLFKRLTGVVREAQLAAMERIRPGIALRDIDGAARKVIARAGYARRFGHSLGHGIGLEVHESPKVSFSEEKSLKKNMVITIEPGIYIENFGGIRIEDMVIIKKDGCENLYDAPRELISIY